MELLEGSASLETKFETFNQIFNYHIDTCCPIKQSKRPPLTKKSNWLTKGILVSRERLKFLSEVSRHTNNIEFQAYFKRYKKTYRKVIQAAKAYEVSKAVMSSTNVSKTAWNIINKNQNKPDQPRSIRIKIQDTLVSDPIKVAEDFNSYFGSVAFQIVPGPLGVQTPLHNKAEPLASMALVPASEDEVAKAIHQIPAKKSNDFNFISPWLVKKCYKNILSPLTKLINLSFQSGIIPAPFKIAKVIPIFKKGDPSCQSNYRPISILPALSKIFEKLFLVQITNFLEKHNLLSENQFGFRKGKSTTKAVVEFVSMVVEGLDGRESTQGVFLDLSKAFDCVDHNILLLKLEQHGIRGLSKQWLKYFLSNRTQIVQVENQTSTKIKLSYGVPQGSILSPLLFLVYVNDIGQSLQRGKLVQYADDSTLCFRSNSKTNLEKEAFVDLNSCIQAFNLINLRVNTAKTNFINFSLRFNDFEYSPAIMLSDTLLEEVNSTKFLGIYLDQRLTWEDHIDNVCSKISAGVYALRSLSKYCPTQVLMMAYYGLIYPHLSYGLSLWSASANVHFLRVFKLQKKSCKNYSKAKKQRVVQNRI